MRLFRTVTALLLLALLLSAILHIALLTSDSSDYKRWVYIQMSLHVVGAWLLWHVRHFRLYDLAGFVVVALLGVYINAVYLNYGNGPGIWLVPLSFLIGYMGLAFFAKPQMGSDDA